MNLMIDREKTCKELNRLFEVLTPREACYKLLLNHLDSYYVTHCSGGYISPKILRICGESIKNSVRNMRMAIQTIDYLNNLLNKINLEFVYIKTYRPLPYAPSDIDVFVCEKDLPMLMKQLKTNGFKITKRGVEMRCYKKGMIRIDIYSSIVYAGIRFNFFEDLLLSIKVSAKFLGIHDIIIPSPHIDALVLLLHDILGHRVINYIDYLYIKKGLLENLDNNIIQNILSSSVEEVKVVKKCLALFLIQQSSGVFDNIAEYPLAVRPSSVLSIIDNASPQRKILYVSSLLIDKLLQLHDRYRNTIPARLKNMVQTLLFYHRLLVGDRHAQW